MTVMCFFFLFVVYDYTNKDVYVLISCITGFHACNIVTLFLPKSLL